ncbi:MAG: hypothetical protein ACRC2T_20500 [Thermoguttaceae bacterium]
MPEREQCVKLLQNWVEEEALVRESVNGFWQTFENWKEDDTEDHRNTFGEDASIVSLQNVTVYLILYHWANYVRLVVAHDVCVDNKVIACYKAAFTLDGEWDDDMVSEVRRC